MTVSLPAAEAQVRSRALRVIELIDSNTTAVLQDELIEVANLETACRNLKKAIQRRLGK